MGTVLSPFCRPTWSGVLVLFLSLAISFVVLAIILSIQIFLSDVLKINCSSLMPPLASVLWCCLNGLHGRPTFLLLYHDSPMWPGYPLLSSIASLVASLVASFFLWPPIKVHDALKLFPRYPWLSSHLLIQSRPTCSPELSGVCELGWHPEAGVECWIIPLESHGFQVLSMWDGENPFTLLCGNNPLIYS